MGNIIIQNKKILLIHTAFPGDLILLLPMIRKMHETLKPKSISILTTLKGREIFQNVEEINQILIYDKRGKDKSYKGFFSIIKMIKNENFDMAFIPHRYLRSALVALLAGIKIRIGFFEFSNFLTSLFYTIKIPRHKNIHEIEKNMQLLSPFSQEIDPGSFAIPFTKAEDSYMQKIISKTIFANKNETATGKYIVIAPCSNWFTKAWPINYYIELAKTFIYETPLKIVLVASANSEDKEACSKIENAISSVRILNLAGRTSFPQLSAIISKASLMITNDSAPMHIGASFDIPLIAIFGSTVKHFGFYPYSKNSTVLEKPIPCRPCGLHGHKECPKVHFKCMYEITPTEVFETAIQILNM